MKIQILVLLFYIIVAASIEVIADDNISQNTENSSKTGKPNNEKCCVTIGYHQGGGSFIGADLEFLVAPRIGAQIGAGYLGFSAAINYHIAPILRSSFISLTYWYVGTGSQEGNEIAGLTFVYRATKAISAQLGAGYIVGQSESRYPNSEIDSRFTGLFSIGFYFPL